MAHLRLLALSIALVLGAGLAGGCVVRGRGSVAYTVDVQPPPPRHVYFEARPGYVWVEGNWQWNGGRWVWSDGYYERQRVGWVWVQGRWMSDGGRHRWQPGRWQSHRGATSGVVVIKLEG